MGDNIYIDFGGNKGSSTDAGHSGWSKVISFGHALMATVSGERDQEGGANVGRPQHMEIDFVKLMDAASTELIKACLSNTAMDVEVHVVRTTGSKPESYLTYKLKNCFVTSLSHSAGADGEGTVESGTLNYGVIEWDFKKLGKKGEAGGVTHAGWNRETGEEV